MLSLTTFKQQLPPSTNLLKFDPWAEFEYPILDTEDVIIIRTGFQNDETLQADRKTVMLLWCRISTENLDKQLLDRPRQIRLLDSDWPRQIRQHMLDWYARSRNQHQLEANPPFSVESGIALDGDSPTLAASFFSKALSDTAAKPSILQLPMDAEETAAAELLQLQQGHVPAVNIIRKQPTIEQTLFINAYLDKPGPTRLVAGPGSGKSFTLVELVRRLIAEGVEASQILSTTYGARATIELRERIAQSTADTTPAQIWLSNVVTTHALSGRLLTEFYGWRRRVPDYKTDKTSELTLLRPLIQKAWPNEKERPSAKEVQFWITQAKANMISNPRQQWLQTQGLSPSQAQILSVIAETLDQQMQDRGFWSFDDQLFLCERQLLQDPVFLQWAQARYSHILVDEAQDSSRQRLHICMLLAQEHHHLILVGDQNQTLMRFSGANPEVFVDEFNRWLPLMLPSSWFLTLNHRSGPVIIEATNQLIRYNYRDRGGPYEQGLLRAMTAHRTDNWRDQVVVKAFSSPYVEAVTVADEIAVLARERSLSESAEDLADIYGTVFILARTRNYLTFFEAALKRHHIPYVNATGSSFWTTGYASKLLAYLRLAQNPKLLDLVGGIANIASDKFSSHTRKLGHEFGRVVKAKGGDVFTALDRVLLDRSQPRYWNAAIHDLRQMLRDIQNELKQNGLVEAIRWIIQHSLKPFVIAEEGDIGDDIGSGPLDDLLSVITFIQEDVCKVEDPPTLEGFLHEISSVSALEGPQPWAGKVVLSTIHSTKGLERDHVFAVGWAQSEEFSMFPHQYSLTEPPRRGKLPGAGKGLLEDERCLAFVAISRAREQVQISYPTRILKTQFGPSQFIAELGLLLTDKQAGAIL